MSPLAANVERFLFEVAEFDEELCVTDFEFREGISQLFHAVIDLACENAELDFEQIVGKAGVLEIMSEDGEEESRYLNGIVSRFEQVAIGVRFSLYRATLVPKIWYLAHRRNCRIFREMKTQDIVHDVLTDAGVPSDEFRFALEDETQIREYCVQYRESELNFISRLLEEEGIYYFFEHDYDKHVLVMASGNAAYPEIAGEPAMLFHDSRFGEVPEVEHVYSLVFREQVRPGAVTLRDYNFVKPGMMPEGNAKGEKDDFLEIYDYPGLFQEPDPATDLARVRLEEYRATVKIAYGKATSPRFCPGFKFTLEEHPRDAFNDEYLLTSVAQTGTQPQCLEQQAAERGTGFSTSFECIPASVSYRPPRITPKPVVEGAQTAIVVGPSGEEIHPDEHGRVKVQFHWDREGQMDDHSSCWIRVNQGWAGNLWGAMFLPRIGQEVIVEFLEGDPDRPIITGRVYHGANQPPYSLPDEKTKSTIKSDSSKGGGGFNEIRFEDKKGEEQVFIHAEKNEDIRVKNDCMEWIGNDHHQIVKKNQVEHVENERHEKVGADHMEEIGADRHLNVVGKQAIKTGGSHSVTVMGDMIEAFRANHSEQTSQNYYLKAMGIVIESMTGITLKCGGSNIVIDQSGVTIKGGIVTIDGGLVKIASGPGSPPQSGSVGSAVAPAVPEGPLEADKADPGKSVKLREQQAAQRERFDFVPLAPLNESEEEELSWIEIELVDEEDNPVVGERYEVTAPDGRVKRGTLDQNGFARIEGINPGECKITFPNLDKDAWETA